jgi:hypothetical protein
MVKQTVAHGLPLHPKTVVEICRQVGTGPYG